MKHEWRKKEKELYIGKLVPAVVTIPSLKYVQVSGVGNPNSAAFKEHIQMLYSISYGIRMMPKGGFTPDGYFEYTVYPLEGDWSSTQMPDDISQHGLDKDRLTYTIMIRQPDFVTESIFQMAFTKASKKINPEDLKAVTFVTTPESKAVQILHQGSYDDEPESFAKLSTFIFDHNLVRSNEAFHREIYLRMDVDNPQKNQTTLRYTIES
ncbi:hypothetical protein G7062_10730 [Erysipelothrix sp. HDW6C]|uniref:GyrI-like domain-containing protein n=1 Tax=Erysipelothrix sp. HDW6C TaxID=2714930 RepID=UPI00140CF0B4|nr:GyrI-like domain-containing protein [Erysipelothrix sp. HDW6C]QIK70740.1 hypothetical protein G7062_10730 [Erysipelothrix sp. HDW6C]